MKKKKLSKSKTPRQIKKWLKKQPWYNRFVYNMDNSRNSSYDHILSGNEGAFTIRISFIWKNSPEGHDFWENIDNQFIQWYNNEEDYNTCISYIFRQGCRFAKNVFQYCGIQKSNRTNNGLKKIKCKDKACRMYKEE